MSYRSLKRVLGETSLERKCRFLFGACLLTLITGSFWWYGRSTKELVYEAGRESARGLVETIIVMHHWKRWQNNDNRDFVELVEDLSQGLASRQYRWRFIHPGGPDGPQDEFENQILTKFPLRKAISAEDVAGTAVPEYAERHVTVDGQAEYQYYTPIRVTNNQSALCHNSQKVALAFTGGDSDIGDLAAIVKVSLPDESQRALNLNNAILLGTAIITVFLAMLASYAIVRYVIVKPLAHLRDVSERISHGDIALRAELHTGDEFEKLATAFNRMLRQLAANQEELKEFNDNLNVKVDELAQANMRLYEMNRLKSDFLATMSHELRTPLNAIIGFSDVLESIPALDDKQKRYVKNIQTSGKVLLEMINDILDLAKIESGKMEVRLSDFPIEAVITAQCDMARPLTERKNIDLECHVERHMPDMFQDQSKVQQILNNLLSNAIKFTPEGGRITITARRAGNNLVMEVADTGVGIAEEDQVAIFEKFRQGKSVLKGGDAMTREYSGTGLGLSIVKELCKLLGGEVTLESELGKGSTFTVRLPWTRSDLPSLDSTLPAVADETPRFRRGDAPHTLEAPAATT
jgi:signal transduction histidine kinase